MLVPAHRLRATQNQRHRIEPLGAVFCIQRLALLARYRRRGWVWQREVLRKLGWRRSGCLVSFLVRTEHHHPPDLPIPASHYCRTCFITCQSSSPSSHIPCRNLCCSPYSTDSQYCSWHPRSYPRLGGKHVHAPAELTAANVPPLPSPRSVTTAGHLPTMKWLGRICDRARG